ncbi:MAG TPA: hydroxymethylbilane synthase, partial [Chloroflexota bacterium]|nr:hydroxymethylbilane synthase [Chloroflexota bacterium]
DARDVLLCREATALVGLASGARVGTSSPRREAQLCAARGDLEFAPIRGNVDTRVRKLESGEYDAIVLAAAGLHRLGIAFPEQAYLAPEICLPAPGQAALCVETLAGGESLGAALDHSDSRRAIEAERAFAAELDAGCQVPLGAYATCSDGDISLRTVVASANGQELLRASGHGRDPVVLGRRLAGEALEQGAGQLLARG